VTKTIDLTLQQPVNRRHLWDASPADTGCVSDSVVRHAAAHLMAVSDDNLAACAAALHGVLSLGTRIYTFGNGGSASTASHLACDLSHRRSGTDSPMARVHCLYDTVVTTAVGNDHGFDQIFARPLRTLLDEKDVLVAISVSGSSPNVLRALELGRERGATNIALLGTDGGKALALCDVWLRIPCDDPGVVESVHLAVVHDLAARAHSLSCSS